MPWCAFHTCYCAWTNHPPGTAMHMHLANVVHAFTMHAHGHGTERIHAVEIEVAARARCTCTCVAARSHAGVFGSPDGCAVFRASNLRSRSGAVLVRNDAFGYRRVVFARSIGGTVPGSLLYAKICAYHADWQTHCRGCTYTCGRCLRARIAHTSTESRCWVLCQQGSFTTTTAMTGRRMSRVRYVCDGGCAVRN